MLAGLLLRFPSAYSFFTFVVGGDSRQRITAAHIRPFAGQRILDIGCGPADILQALPNGVDYVGFDESEMYIQAARRRFGARGQFHCARVTAELAGRFSGFDVVLAMGVLHHLDDAGCEALFRIARAALRPGGRLVTLDGCFTEAQNPLARYLLRRDRGGHVRTERGYLDLAKAVFPSVSGRIYEDLMRLPYTHLVMECGF